MRKCLVGILVLCLAAVCVYGEEQEQTFVNDGGIVISGTVPEAAEGSVVTITVTEAGTEWLDPQEWLQAQGEQVAYYGETSAGPDGVYEFVFLLSENGLYNVYVGSGERPEPIVSQIRYINEQDNQSAILLLKQAQTPEEVHDVLVEKRQELGLFDTIYQETNLADTADILYEELADISDLSAREAVELIQNTMLIALLNQGAVTDIDSYQSYMYLEETELASFYSASISQAVTRGLQNQDIGSREEFLDLLRDQLILANINQNDGTGIIKRILSVFGSYLGVSPAQSADTLASELANHGGFSDIGSLKAFISSGTDSESGSQSSRPSGGGGSGGGYPNASAGSGNMYEGTVSFSDPARSDVMESPVFEDIEDVPWAQEAITQLYWRGVINGKSETLFSPHDFVTREEFVKMLTLAFSMNLVGEEIPFTDVAEDAWCYPYIRTAYLAGITTGISADTFGMGQNIIRQDICVMLYKALDAADMVIPEGTAVTFDDEDQISDYAKEAVNKAAAAAIVSGDGSGAFLPQANATRAEAAKMIYNTISAASAAERG